MLEAAPIKVLMKKNGWLDLGKQRQKIMLSFRKKGTFTRLNYFLSTRTVTIQTGMFPTRSFPEIDTAEKLQEILDTKK